MIIAMLLVRVVLLFIFQVAKIIKASILSDCITSQLCCLALYGSAGRVRVCPIFIFFSVIPLTT